MTGIEITLSSADPDRLLSFYQDGLEFGPVSRHTVRCGETLLNVAEGPAARTPPTWSAQDSGIS